MHITDDFYCDFVLNKKIKVKVVIETDNVLAFYHTKPSWTTHVVVISKKHIKDLTELEDNELLLEIFQVIKQVIQLLEFDRFNFKIVNNGGSFQDSKHLHFHILSGRPIDKGK